MGKIKLRKNYMPYIFIGIFLAAFAIMFAINFILPLDKMAFIHFNDITSRLWCYSDILISLFAILYILNIKKFTKIDLIVSIILGIIIELSGYLADKNFLGNPITAIATAICYYSGCQIFRLYNQENKYFAIKIKTFFKTILFGIALAIPFSIINAPYEIFVKSHQLANFNLINIVYVAFCILYPGIHEEIVWHFFLLALATRSFKGNIPRNKATICFVYFLCAVPHAMIHLPDVFVLNPIGGLFNTLVLMLFGIPMVWLVRNKNLQTSIAFHWMIDFVKYLFANI